MNASAMRLMRVPLTIAMIWPVLAVSVPPLMTRYAPYVTRPGFDCAKTAIQFSRGPDLSPGACRTLADLYGQPFLALFADSAFRSLALLAGAAVLALVIGTMLGVVAALWRRRAIAGGVVVGGTTMLAAVPAFFVAYFLQILVITIGASATSRERLLPVYGFGYDEHLILPLLSISYAVFCLKKKKKISKIVYMPKLSSPPFYAEPSTRTSGQ